MSVQVRISNGGEPSYLSSGFLSNLTEMSAAERDRWVPAGRSADRRMEKRSRIGGVRITDGSTTCGGESTTISFRRLLPK